MAASRTSSPAQKTMSAKPKTAAKTTTAKTAPAKPKPATKTKAPSAAAAKTSAAKPKTAASAGAAKPARIFGMPFASVYPLYVQKAEKKGRTKEEVDAVVTWLTGYEQPALERVIADRIDFETFFAQAPRLNPNVHLVKGVVCGVRVENVEDPLMQKIRYLDLLVDELARGKKLASILRALAAEARCSRLKPPRSRHAGGVPSARTYIERE